MSHTWKKTFGKRLYHSYLSLDMKEGSSLLVIKKKEFDFKCKSLFSLLSPSSQKHEPLQRYVAFISLLYYNGPNQPTAHPCVGLFQFALGTTFIPSLFFVTLTMTSLVATAVC